MNLVPPNRDYPWRGESPLKTADGEVRVDLSRQARPSPPSSGDGLRIRYSNAGQKPVTLYGALSPWSRWPRTSVLGVFRPDGTYLGDGLATEHWGSPECACDASFWVTLPPGGFCGSEIPPSQMAPLLRNRLGVVTHSEYVDEVVLQVIVMNSVLATRGWGDLEEKLRAATFPSPEYVQTKEQLTVLQGAQACFPIKESFRSNRLRLPKRDPHSLFVPVDARPSRTDPRAPREGSEERPAETKPPSRIDSIFRRIEQASKPLRDRRPLEAERPRVPKLACLPAASGEASPTVGGRTLLDARLPDGNAAPRLEVDLGFAATELTRPLFNPFFDKALPSPARLLVFDDSLNYIGELPLGGAAAGLKPPDGAFRRLEARQFAGASFSYPVRPPAPEEAQGVRDGSLILGAGNFVVQAVFLQRFAWEPSPTDRIDRIPTDDAWISPKADWEGFRSEAVPFQVTE